MGGLLGLVLLSLVAGWIASRLVRRRLGLFDGLVLGAIGIVVGGLVTRALGIPVTGLVMPFAAAVGGAVLVAALAALMRRR